LPEDTREEGISLRVRSRVLSPRNLIRARFGWYRETHSKWNNVGCISSLTCILALDEDLDGRTSPTRHLTVLGISVALPENPARQFWDGDPDDGPQHKEF
jgi:hypothetical protein